MSWFGENKLFLFLVKKVCVFPVYPEVTRECNSQQLLCNFLYY